MVGLNLKNSSLYTALYFGAAFITKLKEVQSKSKNFPIDIINIEVHRATVVAPETD
ncbi:hypothetical protein TDB9533_03033 [Thalassocella blandensis]|nr:hypothetical protein TDB9533_03033 [Thalassocella blandensis]